MQVAVVQSPPLPFLLTKTAQKLLANALPPASKVPTQAAPAAQLLALVQSLLTLLRRLLPLLTSVEASVLLPQHGPVDTAALGDPAAQAKQPAPEGAASAVARPGLVAGPLTDLLTAPLRTRWLQGTSVPQQAADLLVAASGGHDPRDEVLDRLLPFWLPVFACDAKLRAGYGPGRAAPDSAQSGGSDGRTPVVSDATGHDESGYWRVVRGLYSHAVSTLGLLATRQVVTGWRALEAALERNTGFAAGRVATGGGEGLSLRQSLQVCFKTRHPIPSRAVWPRQLYRLARASLMTVRSDCMRGALRRCPFCSRRGSAAASRSHPSIPLRSSWVAWAGVCNARPSPRYRAHRFRASAGCHRRHCRTSRLRRRRRRRRHCISRPWRTPCVAAAPPTRPCCPRGRTRPARSACSRGRRTAQR